jgi:hypothetical protein
MKTAPIRFRRAHAGVGLERPLVLGLDHARGSPESLIDIADLLADLALASRSFPNVIVYAGQIGEAGFASDQSIGAVTNLRPTPVCVPFRGNNAQPIRYTVVTRARPVQKYPHGTGRNSTTTSSPCEGRRFTSHRPQFDASCRRRSQRTALTCQAHWSTHLRTCLMLFGHCSFQTKFLFAGSETPRSSRRELQRW